MNKIDLFTVLEPVARVVVELIPGAFGAFLGVVFQGGALTWTQRVLQFAVGVIVSHYVGGWLIASFDMHGLAADTIKLGFGMSAYEAARRFRQGLIEVAGEAPGDIWNAIKGRFSK